MSKTLSAFMRSNVAPITNHFYAASPRFKADGLGNLLHFRR